MAGRLSYCPPPLASCSLEGWFDKAMQQRENARESRRRIACSPVSPLFKYVLSRVQSRLGKANEARVSSKNGEPANIEELCSPSLGEWPNILSTYVYCCVKYCGQSVSPTLQSRYNGATHSTRQLLRAATSFDRAHAREALATTDVRSAELTEEIKAAAVRVAHCMQKNAGVVSNSATEVEVEGVTMLTDTAAVDASLGLFVCLTDDRKGAAEYIACLEECTSHPLSNLLTPCSVVLADGPSCIVAMCLVPLQEPLAPLQPLTDETICFELQMALHESLLWNSHHNLDAPPAKTPIGSSFSANALQQQTLFMCGSDGRLYVLEARGACPLIGHRALRTTARHGQGVAKGCETLLLDFFSTFCSSAAAMPVWKSLGCAPLITSHADEVRFEDSVLLRERARSEPLSFLELAVDDIISRVDSLKAEGISLVLHNHGLSVRYINKLHARLEARLAMLIKAREVAMSLTAEDEKGALDIRHPNPNIPNLHRVEYVVSEESVDGLGKAIRLVVVETASRMLRGVVHECWKALRQTANSPSQSSQTSQLECLDYVLRHVFLTKTAQSYDFFFADDEEEAPAEVQVTSDTLIDFVKHSCGKFFLPADKPELIAWRRVDFAPAQIEKRLCQLCGVTVRKHVLMSIAPRVICSTRVFGDVPPTSGESQCLVHQALSKVRLARRCAPTLTKFFTASLLTQYRTFFAEYLHPSADSAINCSVSFQSTAAKPLAIDGLLELFSRNYLPGSPADENPASPRSDDKSLGGSLGSPSSGDGSPAKYSIELLTPLWEDAVAVHAVEMHLSAVSTRVQCEAPTATSVVAVGSPCSSPTASPICVSSNGEDILALLRQLLEAFSTFIERSISRASMKVPDGDNYRWFFLARRTAVISCVSAVLARWLTNLPNIKRGAPQVALELDQAVGTFSKRLSSCVDVALDELAPQLKSQRTAGSAASIQQQAPPCSWMAMELMNAKWLLHASDNKSQLHESAKLKSEDESATSVSDAQVKFVKEWFGAGVLLADAQNDAGLALTKLGKFDAALATFTEALKGCSEESQTYWLIYNNIAYVNFVIGQRHLRSVKKTGCPISSLPDYSPARRSFLTAEKMWTRMRQYSAKLSPVLHADALNNSACLQMLNHKFLDAQQSFEESMKVTSGLTDAHSSRVVARENLAKCQKKIRGHAQAAMRRWIWKRRGRKVIQYVRSSQQFVQSLQRIGRAFVVRSMMSSLWQLRHKGVTFRQWHAILLIQRSGRGAYVRGMLSRACGSTSIKRKKAPMQPQRPAPKQSSNNPKPASSDAVEEAVSPSPPSHRKVPKKGEATDAAPCAINPSPPNHTSASGACAPRHGRGQERRTSVSSCDSTNSSRSSSDPSRRPRAHHPPLQRRSQQKRCQDDFDDLVPLGALDVIPDAPPPQKSVEYVTPTLVAQRKSAIKLQSVGRAVKARQLLSRLLTLRMMRTKARRVPQAANAVTRTDWAA